MTEDAPIKPWYKQFWPWFLIALPMTAVIGSMITISLAITDTDGLVKDDYYKEGLAVNANKARKQMAEDLGIAATGELNRDNGNIEVIMNDAPIGNFESLTLKMIHPTRANQDIDTFLKSSDGKTFTGVIEQELLAGHWWVRLAPENNAWYIEGRMLYPQNNRVVLN